MKTDKIRHQFYLPAALSAKLDALVERRGTTKTEILADALTQWLDRGAAQEMDERFGPRLDRISNALDRAEQKLDLTAETLAVFVQHQLTLTAHQPTFDNETSRLGRERFQQVIDLVGRRLAGRGSFAQLGLSSKDKQ